jgi:bacterioferritin-associated ferredoxin
LIIKYQSEPAQNAIDNQSHLHLNVIKEDYPVYVCLCKGVTCGAIRSAVTEQGAVNLRDLSRNLGVATQCGKCAHAARKVLDEALGACAGCCGASAETAA